MNNDGPNTTTPATDIDIVIVGFGFSCIPLLRELERTGEKYVIVSEQGGSIWAKLEREGRLDFDLVSSRYSSFYSFDLVKDLMPDSYPTAREFYEMHKRHYALYAKHHVEDWVVAIDNHDAFSYVRTKSGLTYKAAKVVVATGFKRAIHDSFKDFDFDIDNQTIVVNSIGDSANLLFAKLTTRDNRVIVVHDGFHAYDKQATYDGLTFTIDQLGHHNVDFLSTRIYRRTLLSTIPPTQALAGIFCPNILCNSRPETARNDMWQQLGHDDIGTSGVPNGAIAIKYWPIDEYAKQFGSDLEGAIARGVLLNDIAYLTAEGRLETWAKRHTTIDRVRKTISMGDKIVRYDHLIESDAEMPNLPPIVIHRDGEAHAYDYVYRENYLGTIPLKLRNVFFVGYTRPITGGLANITEMQCLLVHKMLTNGSFNRRIYQELPERFKAYNKRYYGERIHLKPDKRDHLVHFGTYTKEVARAIGIDTNLSDCNSWAEVKEWIFSPNAAFKFRECGEYKVDGVDKLVKYISANHHNWEGLSSGVTYYVVLHVMLAQLGVLLFATNWLSALGLGLYLAGVYSWAWIPISGIYINSATTNRALGKLKVLYLLPGLVASAAMVNHWILLGTFGIDIMYTYLLRQTGQVRCLFNDVKYKQDYRDFYERYCRVYNSVKEKQRGCAMACH